MAELCARISTVQCVEPRVEALSTRKERGPFEKGCTRQFPQCRSGKPWVTADSMIMTRHEILVLPFLFHQTNLGADDGGRDHSDKRESHVEWPRDAAEEPVLYVAFVLAG